MKKKNKKENRFNKCQISRKFAGNFFEVRHTHGKKEIYYTASQNKQFHIVDE